MSVWYVGLQPLFAVAGSGDALAARVLRGRRRGSGELALLGEGLDGDR